MPDLAPEVELTIVTLVFDAVDADKLMPILSRYVVMSRMQPGARNIDFCASVTTPNRFLVVEKWETPEAQRVHFDSADMVTMAESCNGLLSGPPQIELYEGISAHDLN